MALRSVLLYLHRSLITANISVLQDSAMYVLEVTARNIYGLTTTARSPVLLLETVKLSAGEVRMGKDVKEKEILFVNGQDPFSCEYKCFDCFTTEWNSTL